MANEKRLIDPNAKFIEKHFTKRLIDAEAIARKLKRQYCAECNVVRQVQCSACWVNDVLEVLDGDSVDAVEVVHAHWEDGCAIHNGKEVYKSIDCSVCHDIFKIESHDREYWKKRFKSCPFCGAVMDEVDGNG